MNTTDKKPAFRGMMTKEAAAAPFQTSAVTYVKNEAKKVPLLCRFIGENHNPVVSFAENEVLIKASICIAQKELSADLREQEQGEREAGSRIPGGTTTVIPPAGPKAMNQLAIRFQIPRGKVSQIMGIMNFLQTKFQSLELELRANDGSMTEEEYIGKIKEALRQLGIAIED